MKALVVYDSYYHNTEKIAEQIGKTLSESGDASVIRSRDVKPEHLKNMDILVAGSPTQKFQPTLDIKELLKSIPQNGLKGVKAAAFDTRISIEDTDSSVLRFFIKLFGYAAKPIAKKLQKKGCELVIPPEGFIVEDTEGPLKEGELERAAQWARRIPY